mmetsp:Transcript_9794/g.18418  ORF Transcript_9794/g.18418 Transcript_9794/m.18418 type:complete len:84 (-) Transcript_9794:1663-1914(-)
MLVMFVPIKYLFGIYSIIANCYGTLEESHKDCISLHRLGLVTHWISHQYEIATFLTFPSCRFLDCQVYAVFQQEFLQSFACLE